MDLMASFPLVVLPTPSQRAAWDKLRYEFATAWKTGNLELATDRAGEAGHQASAFWGRDSLMAVEHHTYVVRIFTEMTLDGPLNIETDGCRRRAMVELLRDVLPKLSQRIEAGTLALGKCRQEEEAHRAEMRALRKDATACSQLSKMVGADHALEAMLATLHLLALRPWQEAQLKTCQNFVLSCLTFLGSCGKAFVDGATPEEKFQVFATLGEDMQSLHSEYDKPFFEEVQQKWQALRETWQRQAAAMEAPRAAPSKKCALPSCDKAERTDGEFSLCALCKAAKYCSKEHQAADWKRHKNGCKIKSEEGMLTARRLQAFMTDDRLTKVCINTEPRLRRRCRARAECETLRPFHAATHAWAQPPPHPPLSPQHRPARRRAGGHEQEICIVPFQKCSRPRPCLQPRITRPAGRQRWRLRVMRAR